MPGPRKLWRTEIVIWSEEKADKIPPGRLVQMCEAGQRAYMSRCHSELVTSPYVQDDGPPDDWEGHFSGGD
jgi:hypothetical protein